MHVDCADAHHIPLVPLRLDAAPLRAHHLPAAEGGCHLHRRHSHWRSDLLVRRLLEEQAALPDAQMGYAIRTLSSK